MATRRKKAPAAPSVPQGRAAVANELVCLRREMGDIAAREGRYRALVEGSPDPCFVCVDGVLAFLNPAAVQLFGATTADELLGRSILDRVHHDFRDVAQRRLHAIATGAERLPTIEMRFLKVDGSTTDAEVESVPIEFDGAPAVYATVHHLRTDRRADALLASCLRIIDQAGALSLAALLQCTLDEAEQLTGSTIGFAHFLDEDQRTLTLTAWSTNTLRAMCSALGAGNHYPVDQAGVWVDCVHVRAPVIHNDYTALTHRKGMPAGHAPVFRELVVPVMRDGLITMILGIGNKSSDYDASDLGTLTRLTELTWDIVERKRAEEESRRMAEELRASNALFRVVAQHYPNAFVSVIEQDLSIGFTSGQAFAKVGLDPQQFVGLSLEQVFGEQTPTVRAHYERTFAGEEQSFTLTVDGQRQRYRTVPLPDQDGSIHRILAVVELIEEQVRAEEKLRSGAALLALAQELTHIGSWELDAVTQQLTWSDETYRMFGVVPQAFGASYEAFLELVHPDDRSAVDRAYMGSVRNGAGSYAIEHRIVRRDTGEVRVVREECRHERDATGRLLRSVGVVQDLTLQRQMEADRFRDVLQLDLAMRESNAATWSWDIASGALEWSAGMFELFGLDPHTTVPSFEAWRAVIHPDDAEHAERALSDAIEHRTLLRSESRVLLPDGRVRWIVGTGRAIYDDSGRPLRVIGLGIDISAAKEAERERLAALELLERTGDMARVGGWELDLATQQLSFTKQALRINEVDPAEGLNFEEALNRVDAAYRPQFREAVQAAIANGTPYDLEVPMVTATGRRIWARTQGSAAFADGKVTKLSGTFQDVTERRMAAEERRRADDRFRSWFALPLVGSCITSPEKGWLEVNDHLCDMLGYQRDELMRATWADLTHPEDLAKDVVQFERVLRGESDGYSLEKRFVRKDGSILESELSVRCVRKADASVDYFVALIKDIGARKRSEDEKAVLEAQLRQAQKMESVGRLAGGVAHDFNNMLGVILGNAELALQQLDESHPLHADLLEIQSAAKRSAALTRQLLTFARRQAVAPAVLNVDEMVRDLLAMLRRLLGEDVSVEWAAEAQLWPILMDPSQLANVLTNLCLNARDAIAGVGHITLAAANRVVDAAFCAGRLDATPGDYVCLSVGDNGSGMDDETMSHMFEPFFTTKGVQEGTGLGLASVYGAISQNNGFIVVTSRLGEGSLFELYLPRHFGR